MVRRGFLIFADDLLVRCMDSSHAITPPDVAWEPTFSNPNLGDRLTVTNVESCDGRMANRPVLARCVEHVAARRPASAPEGVMVESTIREYTLSFAALVTDSSMRRCMEAGGEWTEMDRSSPEYIQARAAYDLERGR